MEAEKSEGLSTIGVEFARACGTCGEAFIPKRARDFARQRFCSRRCACSAAGLKGGAASASLDWTGANNPAWRGGISKNHYAYKLRQKERYPERVAARDKVRSAVRSGRLKRGACEHCGEPKTFAHHEDYGKPLQVRWLCRPCHRAEHGGQH